MAEHARSVQRKVSILFILSLKLIVITVTAFLMTI
jgi:hypothetical protein